MYLRAMVLSNNPSLIDNVPYGHEAELGTALG